MNKDVLTLLILLISMTASSQDVFGKWKTIDDVSGKERSIIEIYKENGKVYGKVDKILDPTAPENPTCDKCDGDDKDAPMIGLVIIKGLERDDDEYNGGKILDPESGTLYKCYISLEEEDKLKVRGYLGFSLFGRTQYWERVK